MLTEQKPEIASKYAKEVRDFVVTNFLFGDGQALKSDDTLFIGAGIIDSTGILELLMFLEETYGIKVETEELLPENLDSVNRVVRFLSRKVAAKNGKG